MDYEIKYRCRKSNVAADALSQCTQMGLSMLTAAVTTPKLVEELRKSWSLPEGYAKLISQLLEGMECKHFTYEQEILRRKGKYVVGPSVELRRKLLSMYHDGVLGRYSGA